MYRSLHYTLPNGYSFPVSALIGYPEESVILMIGSALLESFSIDRLYECYWYLTNIDDRSFDINMRIPDDLDLDFTFKYTIANTIEKINKQKKLNFDYDEELYGFDIKSITDFDFLHELFYSSPVLINGDYVELD